VTKVQAVARRIHDKNATQVIIDNVSGANVAKIAYRAEAAASMARNTAPMVVVSSHPGVSRP
jgi:hypothetical protein